jgi:hypothetical protein
MSLLRSLVGSSRSIAKTFVTPRYASRSSMASHHRPLIVGYPHPAIAPGIKVSGFTAAAPRPGRVWFSASAGPARR